MIVITRLSPEQIHSEQTAIQAQIELLLATVVALHIDMLQVYGITQKHPSPSQIRSQSPRRVRCKRDALPILTIEGIDFVGIGILEHHGIVVMLRLDILFVDIRKFAKEIRKSLSQTVEEGFLMSGTRQAILRVSLEHRRVEKRFHQRRIGNSLVLVSLALVCLALTSRQMRRFPLHRHHWQQSEQPDSH